MCVTLCELSSVPACLLLRGVAWSICLLEGHNPCRVRRLALNIGDALEEMWCVNVRDVLMHHWLWLSLVLPGVSLLRPPPRVLATRVKAMRMLRKGWVPRMDGSLCLSCV